jgi:aryl-alcohol dehydrogenase-like predicted oxidoreductase
MSIRDKLLSGPLGFGAAPLGNMFRNIPDDEAAATVDATWRQGTRYFDTAPACPSCAWASRWPNTSATNTCSAARSAG